MSKYSVEKWKAILDAIEWFREFCRDNDAEAISQLSHIAADARRYRYLRSGPPEVFAFNPEAGRIEGDALDGVIDGA